MATGPSTTTSPYLLASEPNVRFTSILTVGDPVPGETVFAGIPDGLGAYDNGDGTITVLVNHEFPAATGLVQDHGSTGAYIDRLVIDKTTLAVVSGDDAIKTVMLWNDTTDSYYAAAPGAGALSRLCSSDLAEVSAFSFGGLGTTTRIYLTGEEVGNEGRATATILTGTDAGTLYELPSLGNMSFENIVANPFGQAKTIVAATDDQGGGQVYLYVGDKQASGSEIAMAGLVGGDFYGIKVAGFPVEGPTLVPNNEADPAASGRFSLQEIGPGGDVSNMTGLDIESESNAEGVTRFLRPEDAAWNPDSPNELYFVTTDHFNGNSRLYRLTFDDITNPAAGGIIESLIPDSSPHQMFDNITVENGKVILQEDPGNQEYLARVWEYDIASGAFGEVAKFDPALFTTGSPDFITKDEESSGVIDVTDMLGDADTRAYLLDAQVHKATGDPATVEMGQLLAMFVDDPFLIGGNGTDDLFGSYEDETLRGGNDDDTAYAGSGNDMVYGDNGEDQLHGGNGDDQLFGGRGADALFGESDDDTLSGGLGGDYFIFDNTGETGTDTITDFAKADRLLVTEQLDADSRGIVRFGVDQDLDLFGSSSVTVQSGSTTLSQLRYAGEVSYDGETYYSYAMVSGGGSDAAALSGLGVATGFKGMDSFDHGLI